MPFTTRKQRQRKQIIDLILISKVSSITRIAQLVEITQAETIAHIKRIVSEANNIGMLGGELRPFRGAHLNLDTLEITLVDASEAPTLGGLFNKAKKAVHSRLSQNVPQQPWACSFCNTSNDPQNQVCAGCAATRQA